MTQPANEQAPQYWIIVSGIENFRKTRELGFTVQGLKSRHRKKAERMKPGDKIIYYITGLKAFGGIATIASEYFESHDRIWESRDAKKKDVEDYPFRVNIAPDLILDESSFVEAEPIALAMEYTERWPKKNWTLAFQGNVHAINESDYLLIRRAIEASASRSAVATTAP
jgi:predicted RNA-binding protein